MAMEPELARDGVVPDDLYEQQLASTSTSLLQPREFPGTRQGEHAVHRFGVQSQASEALLPAKQPLSNALVKHDSKRVGMMEEEAAGKCLCRNVYWNLIKGRKCAACAGLNPHDCAAKKRPHIAPIYRNRCLWAKIVRGSIKISQPSEEKGWYKRRHVDLNVCDVMGKCLTVDQLDCGGGEHCLKWGGDCYAGRIELPWGVRALLYSPKTLETKTRKHSFWQDPCNHLGKKDTAMKGKNDFWQWGRRVCAFKFELDGGGEHVTC